MEARVATWNLFHGRSVPAARRGLLHEFAAGLAAHPWDVIGLQEAPPWWADELAVALGASARGARTSYLRGALPGLQRAIHERNPELLKTRGAAANILLVRPGAGAIVDHRAATLRWLPQRRSVHAVRLRVGASGGPGRAGDPGAGAGPGRAGDPRAGGGPGSHWWVANVHTHNRPESLAAADLIRALRIARAWAGDEPLVLLGDLNLAAPQGVARVEGFEPLFGHRVDHLVGRGVQAAGHAFAARIQPEPGRTLSDHSLVGLTVHVPPG